MSFRGLDFSQGFGKYADLLRAAADQRVALDQQHLKNQMEAQQAASLYGGSYPGLSQEVENPFYVPDPNQLPMSGIPVEAAPRYDVPAMGGEGPPPGVSMNPAQGNRMPANRAPSVEPDYYKQVNQESARLTLEALQRKEAERKAREKAGLPPEQPSKVDQLISQYSHQRTLHPMLRRELMKLVEEQAQRQGSGENPMVALAKILANSRPQKEGQGRVPPQPYIERLATIANLQSQQKDLKFEPSDIAKMSPGTMKREYESWKKSPNGQQWQDLQGQINALNSGPKQPAPRKLYPDHKIGDKVTKDVLLQRYPKLKAQIEKLED